ncbi:hypothetical protein ASPACDRAFT_1860436 [Aspergillus aculeatus ATCC 16872]|uniref:Uncharacterized protein n=1 Tax=Aspergillus aculeatus (strain ATCC 16872 / CBS 172.66 / WB 5094) TaxID=690307 RepID=A0A1L9WG28_ASPA1|nr:uncharacterized protein ASPACDRAFT_1860436 [Aspergillus aculeatus ATCC 16872]OJJ95057.1 hypothetical protein ASPACDRAFT_1860436 [Aspergillus aculeatus ATCC 16872]
MSSYIRSPESYIISQLSHPSFNQALLLYSHSSRRCKALPAIMLSHTLTFASLLLGLALASTPETLTVHSSHGADHRALIQSIYDANGGTFSLSHLGEHFETASISGLVLFNSTAEYDLPSWWTSASSPVGNLSTVPLTSSSNHRRRAAVSYANPVCETPPTDDYRLLTKAQQEFLAGPACNALSYIAPDVFAYFGLIASNVKCGADLTFTCQVGITIAATEAGRWLGTGIQNACAETLASLDAECPEVGGAFEATVAATGSTFVVSATANSLGEAGCDDLSVSTSVCYAYTCNGECNPGNELP